MSLKPFIACASVAISCWGAGTFPSTPSTSAPEAAQVQAEYVSPVERTRPLLNLIARGEGNYNAINRGRAGDTPGGIQWLKGQTFENFTVGQVLQMQRWQVYAVGRYQFIPSTLRWAVNSSEVSELDMFTPETQDKLALHLIMQKRPAVGSYIRGEHNQLGWAMNEMAKEWASIEYRYGRGYYDGIGGNRAHTSRVELSTVLQEVKAAWQANTSAS